MGFNPTLFDGSETPRFSDLKSVTIRNMKIPTVAIVRRKSAVREERNEKISFTWSETVRKRRSL